MTSKIQPKTSRKPIKVYTEPIRYVVGEDISEEQWAQVILGVAEWFSKTRATKEPVLAAKQALQECLDGVTKDGEKWFAMARSTLTARVRAKCRYDIEKMMAMETPSELKRAENLRARKRAAEKAIAQKKAGDTLIPDEMRKEVAKEATYGDDPTIHLNSREMENWKQLRAAYIQQFPDELSTVAAQAELETLLDLHIMNERHRMIMLSGRPVDISGQTKVVQQIDTIKSSLGIHPDQLAKRIKTKSDTTIGAAAVRLEQQPDWRKLRNRFWAEELIQLFQMYHTPSADGQTHQLDEVGLFGVTRCRTCECPKCGQRNFVGIGIHEIEEYLVAEGHLEPVSASPQG